METLYSLCEKMDRLAKELDSRPELRWSDLGRLDELLDDMKDAETVIAMRNARMMEQEGNYSRGHYVRGHYSNGYSGDGYSGNRSYGYSGNRYSNGMENDGMYMPNGSYGNYSGYGHSNGNYGRYSRDDAQERMRQQLERMMGEAQSDQVREALQGALSRMG